MYAISMGRSLLRIDSLNEFMDLVDVLFAYADDGAALFSRIHADLQERFRHEVLEYGEDTELAARLFRSLEILNTRWGHYKDHQVSLCRDYYDAMPMRVPMGR